MLYCKPVHCKSSFAVRQSLRFRTSILVWGAQGYLVDPLFFLDIYVPFPPRLIWPVVSGRQGSARGSAS